MKTAIQIICTSLLAAMMSSCSIKEDRTPCPGYLEIGLDACAPFTGGVHLSGWNGDGILFDKRVDISKNPGNIVGFSVPKGEFGYCAWFGLRNWKDDVVDRKYLIPFGKEADPLYATPVDGLVMTGEFLRDEVIPHRQHCVLTLVVTGIPPENMQGMLIGLSSSTAGISMDDLSPVKGDFLVTGVPDRQGHLSFTLIRQGFGDLKANLFDNGRIAASYDLTSLLDMLGYDWTAEDLEDVTLEFEISASTSSIVMRPWEDGGSLTPVA